MTSWPAIVLTAAVTMSPSAAAAQAEPVDAATTARGHLGPVHFTPRLVLNEVGVDTNVFHDAEERRDLTLTLTPLLDLWVPFGRRALMSTAVAVPFVYYQTYSSERSVDFSVSTRVTAYRGRFSPFVEGAVSRSHQRPNLEIDVREEQERRAVRIGVVASLTPRLTMELAARLEAFRYDADAVYDGVRLNDTLGHGTRGGTMVVRHALTPLTTLLLSADVELKDFPDSPLRDSHTLRVRPGLEFKPTALIVGTMLVGIRRFGPADALVEPFNGVVANGDLSYTLLGDTKFTVRVARDVNYSYQHRQPYFVASGYGLAIRRRLIRQSDVTFGMDRFDYAYRDLLIPAASPIDRVDRTHAWLLSVGYRVGHSARVGIGGSYQQRTSNTSSLRDYEGFRVGITVGYER